MQTETLDRGAARYDGPLEILGFDESVRAFMKQLEKQSAEAARARDESPAVAS